MRGSITSRCEQWVVAASRKVNTKPGDHGIHMGEVQGLDLYVHPDNVMPTVKAKAKAKAKTDPSKKDDQNENRSFISLFWAVPPAKDKKRANMTLEFQSETIGSGFSQMVYRIPVLTNTKALKAGDFLECEPREKPAKKPKLGD